MPAPVHVTLPSDTEVRVTRQFNAPRQLVWDAHVKPELFKQWIGGYPGWTMPVCEMDVREGGKYRWGWRNEDGKEFGFYGEFTEVKMGARIVAKEYYDPGNMGGSMTTDPTIVSSDFTEAGRVTTLTVTIKYVSQEARDGAVASGMTDGMEVSYARLDDLAAKAA
jgi:uncharacterized protein YndB with AHSA1/START domain